MITAMIVGPGRLWRGFPTYAKRWLDGDDLFGTVTEQYLRDWEIALGIKPD